MAASAVKTIVKEKKKKKSEKIHKRITNCFCIKSCFGFSKDAQDNNYIEKPLKENGSKGAKTDPVNDPALTVKALVVEAEEKSSSSKEVTELGSSESTILPQHRAEKRKSRSKGKKGNELEPFFGALILTVVLVVMLVWGKAYAVLCAAAWLYLVRRWNYGVAVRASPEEKSEEEAASVAVDLTSDEQKHRVVLEGFLERRNQK